jgi:hypothetical protein
MDLQGYRYSPAYYDRGGFAPFPSETTIPGLAQRIGVRFDSSIRPEDVTLREIRQLYAKHHLHDDEARLLEQEINAESDPDTRLILRTSLADALAASGEQHRATALAQQIEEELLARIEASPNLLDYQAQLIRLYASRAYGPDTAKAAQAMRRLRAISPMADYTHAREAQWLFEVQRYAEAWPLYRDAMKFDDVDRAYRAGISAHHAGETAMAQRLIRSALWRDPTHELAAQAKELLQ